MKRLTETTRLLPFLSFSGSEIWEGLVWLFFLNEGLMQMWSEGSWSWSSWGLAKLLSLHSATEILHPVFPHKSIWTFTARQPQGSGTAYLELCTSTGVWAPKAKALLPFITKHQNSYSHFHHILLVMSKSQSHSESTRGELGSTFL